MNKLIKILVSVRNYLIFKKYNLLAQTRTTQFSKDTCKTFAISISSYPARIHLVPAVFESIGRQSTRPLRYFLVLTEEEWPKKRVPSYISKLADRGVEIFWVKGNSFAVKNVTPLVDRFPDLGIVILDDDIIYGKHVVNDLVNNEHAKSGAIVGHVAKALHRKGDSLSMWYRNNKPADLNTPSSSVFFIGYSGIYYPSNTLDKRVSNLEAIKKIVPGRGKDIWLYAAALAANSKQICLGSDHSKGYYIPIPVSTSTKPREQPGKAELDKRFQKAIDYFGIREKLLKTLPEASQ